MLSSTRLKGLGTSDWSGREIPIVGGRKRSAIRREGRARRRGTMGERAPRVLRRFAAALCEMPFPSRGAKGMPTSKRCPLGKCQELRAIARGSPTGAWEFKKVLLRPCVQAIQEGRKNLNQFKGLPNGSPNGSANVATALTLRQAIPHVQPVVLAVALPHQQGVVLQVEG